FFVIQMVFYVWIKRLQMLQALRVLIAHQLHLTLRKTVKVANEVGPPIAATYNADFDRMVHVVSFSSLNRLLADSFCRMLIPFDLIFDPLDPFTGVAAVASPFSPPCLRFSSSSLNWQSNVGTVLSMITQSSPKDCSRA